MRVRQDSRAGDTTPCTVNDVVALELLPLVHGLPAPPAQVTVPVRGHEAFAVGCVVAAEPLGGGTAVPLPVGHGRACQVMARSARHSTQTITRASHPHHAVNEPPMAPMNLTAANTRAASHARTMISAAMVSPPRAWCR